MAASAEKAVPIDRSWDSSAVTVDHMHELKTGGGVWLSWNDLTVDVDVPAGFLKKERKKIVHGSRGRARPGELLAVMGPSGAGKSTLFNALALRGQGYHVGGQLTLNGMPYEKTDLKKVSGFVFQDSVSHFVCLLFLYPQTFSLVDAFANQSDRDASHGC